jgi:hypothetical protein
MCNKKKMRLTALRLGGKEIVQLALFIPWRHQRQASDGGKEDRWPWKEFPAR